MTAQRIAAHGPSACGYSARGLSARGSLLCLFCLLFAVASPSDLWAQKLQVDLQLEPSDVIGLDELAVLTLKIAAADRLRSDPETDFQFENVNLAAGPSRSHSLRFVDGAPSRTLTLTWHLQPLAVGKARIHSGVLILDGDRIELPQRRIEVVRVAPTRRSSGRARDVFRDPFSPQDPDGSPFRASRPRRQRRSVEPPKVYLSAEAIPRNPYVGQQVLFTLYLFTQADVRSVNPEELPDFKGFWSRTIPQPEQLQPDMLYLDGERIGKVVLLQRALFPRRAGRLEIDSATARLSAMIQDKARFGSLLPRPREIVRSSKSLTLNVRELPPAPDGFNGAVGQLTLSARLEPFDLEVGQAATLTLQLEGQGHLQGLPVPQLPDLQGIEIFPPQQQSTETIRRRSVSGERTWSFVLVPQRPGQWQLPAVEIPYFDPREERYRIAEAQPPKLTVRGTTRLADDPSLELHPIRSAALPATGGNRVRALEPVFFVTPLALALFLLTRRRESGSGPKSDRRRLLDRLALAAAEQRPRQAAAQIEEAWRDFLHARWGLPPGSPSTRWGSLLPDRGVPAKVAKDLVVLAEDLHYLRYAPKLSSTAELRQDLIDRSRKLARATQ